MQPVLDALIDPTRRSALLLLNDSSEHCLCELMDRLDVTQSRMSRHMKVLREAGLVSARRDRQWVRYRINADLPSEIAAIVRTVLAASKTTEKELVS